jgi:hypothetical protein
MIYIGSYISDLNKIIFDCSLSSINKMDYISNSLADFSDVEILSCAFPKKFLSKNIHFSGTKIELSKNVILSVGPFINPKFLISSKINKFLLFFWLLNKLLSVKKNEIVIVYHIPRLFLPIYIAKMIKKFKLILEIEEIYMNVYGLDKLNAIKEKALISISDKYILSTDRFFSTIPFKSNVLVHGSYLTKELNYNYRNDESINLIYSGLIEDLKNGASKAVELMNFLPKNYILHITGYGESKLIENLIKRINFINGNSIKPRIKYHGTLNKAEYQSLMKMCQIGLNLQDVSTYTKYEFPSKILTYLSYNLRVVSTKSEAVYHSTLNKIIFFTSDDLSNIANEIIKINLKEEYDSIKLIKNLDINFRFELKNLINTNE